MSHLVSAVPKGKTVGYLSATLACQSVMADEPGQETSAARTSERMRSANARFYVYLERDMAITIQKR